MNRSTIISPTNSKDTRARTDVMSLTLSQAVTRFTQEYVWARGYTNSTADNYYLAVKSLTKVIGNKDITELVMDDIYRWREFVEAHHMERNVVNTYLYKIRKILQFYNQELVLRIDPQRIQIPKKSQTLPKFLTIEEVQRLLDAGDVREKAIVAMLYSTGMRVGEVGQLRIKDVSGSQVTVRGKGDQQRIVFIDESATFYINQYIITRDDPNPYLFASKKGGGIGKHRIEDIIKNLGATARIDKHVTPHTLRHSFATHMAQNGCGVFHLQKLLGHAHISTTQIYVHLGTKDMREAYKQYHPILFKKSIDKTEAIA